MLFSLPDNYIGSTTEMINTLANDLIDLIILALGIAIGFYFINKLVGLIIGTMKKR